MAKKPTPMKPAEMGIKPGEAGGGDNLYRDIVERSIDGIAIVQDGIVCYASPRLAELWGGSREDIISSALSDYIHPEDRPTALARYMRRLAGEPIPSAFEIRLLRKDGRTVWADVSGGTILYGGRPADLLFIRDVDERKRAEAALRASEEKYRLHLENISDVIYALDTELHVITISPSVEKILGYKPEELVGKSFGELNMVTPESMSTAYSNITRIFAGETISSTVYEFVTKDGRKIIGEVSGTPLIRDGKIIGLVAVARDITERRKSEQALAASVRELEESRRRSQETSAILMSVLESPQDVVIFALDGSYRYLAFNKAHKSTMKAIWGVDIEIGSGMLDYISDPGDREKARMNFDRALRGEAFARIEEYGDVGLQRRYYEDKYSPIREDDGAVIGLTVFLTDITEPRRVQEALRESRGRLDLALRSAHMGVWRWNIPENRREFDQQTCRLLGFDPASFKGDEETFYGTVHPDDRERIREALRNSVENDLPYEADYRAVWPDGSVHDITTRGMLTSDAAGRPARISGVLWDITERKKAEAQVLASLREKEVLLRELHHRVKNNMQVVSSLLSLQGKSLGDPRVEQLFKETQTRIRSMALVHEKLYQSKDLSKVPFNEYIESLAVHLFHSFDIPASRIDLKTDMQRIFLDIETAIPCGLLVNEILSNALKHAFPGGRKGRIEITFRSRDDHRLFLGIKDDGIGLPPGFDVQKAGTLGMQIITSLVEQIDGALEIVRERGVEFRIVFKEVKYSSQP
jgi:PAS domain S-box-containing protein